MIDLSLNIHPQALAVLHSLEGLGYQLEDEIKAKDSRVTTTALYNGRERGICISVQTHLLAEARLLIFFTESRSSDQLFVQSCLKFGSAINPPTIEDFTELSYQNRKYFQEWNVNGARNHIIGLIKKHLRSCHLCGSELMADGWCGDNIGKDACEFSKAPKRKTA